MAPRAMQLTDWLDDLSVRFIVNLPSEEFESMERICFQVEEAQWFYEDFVRPSDPNLPSLNLRQFSMKIFQHCPLFSGFGADAHAQAFSEFLAYKTRVPVRGAILLNEAMDEVILVKGWKKGANWSFPRGKINKDEKDIDCAIREVYEETGFDINAAGLNTGEENARFIEVTMREQHMKLFVFAGIPMSTYFEPRTRKEISAIQWYKLSELPTLRKVKQQDGSNQPPVNNNKFYMVAPFVKPLKRIISQLRKEKAIEYAAQYADSTYLVPQEPLAAPINVIGVGDMNRLMAQLRQSSQASRESNYPEVSNQHDASQQASSKLRSMLNLPSVSEEQSAEPEAAAVRENKASAMLSLLRSGPSPAHPPVSGGGQPPQTPFEQTFGPPSQPPASPHHQHNLRTPQSHHAPPPVFEVSPDHVPGYFPRQGPPRIYPAQSHSPHIQVSPQEQQAMLPPFLRDPPQGPMYNRQPMPAAPYRQTGDPQFGSSQAQGPAASAIPHASKLPPPRLNAHSSNLLNIFKSSKPEAGPSVVTSIEVSAPISEASTSARPELSAPSPVTTRQHSVTMPPGQPAMLSSTPALAVAHSDNSAGETPKRTAQQEALLGLFRLAKPSPSLAPPLDPVELSAQGSPTHHRVNSDQNFPRLPSSSLAHGAVNASRKPARESLQNNGRVSATVSGPLNVPQFEILQRPVDTGREDEPQVAVKLAQAAAPQAVKILSRPSTAIRSGGEAGSSAQPIRSPRHNQNQASKPKTSPKDVPFQPQILKRPTPTSSQHDAQSPRSVPAPNEPQKLPLHPSIPNSGVGFHSATSPILDQRSPQPQQQPQSQTQTQDQKATLLSLFGRAAPQPSASVQQPQQQDFGPQVTIPPQPHSHDVRHGSMVSPVSENPASGLPSPSWPGKSRVGSLQEMDGEPAWMAPLAPLGPLEHRPSLPRTRSSEAGGNSGTAGGGAQTPSVASPVDRKFLLGFLDSVASGRGT